MEQAGPQSASIKWKTLERKEQFVSGEEKECVIQVIVHPLITGITNFGQIVFI